MYQYISLSGKYSIPEISSDMLLNDGLPGYITEMEELSNFGWAAFLYRPASSISAAAINITYIVLAMILLCIALIFLLSTLLSKIIVSPIEKLSANMEQVEQTMKLKLFLTVQTKLGSLFLPSKKWYVRLTI